MLYDYVHWFRSVVQVLDDFGSALDEFEIGFTYWDNDRFADAAEQMSTVREHLDEAGRSITTANDRADQVDATEIDFDSWDILDVRHPLDELDEAITAMDILADGFEDLSHGFDQFLSGAEAFDEEQWNEAADTLDGANDSFVVAESVFQDGEQQTDGEMRADFIEFTCMAGRLADGTGALSESAAAAADGDDSTMNEKYEAYQDAMADFDECGG